MSTLLRSNVFYSARAYRALVKSPVEFVVGTYRLFGVPNVDDSALASLRRMGQILFHPPSVKGWDGGIAWLNSGTLLARENFASALMVSPMTKDGSWLTAAGPRSAREAAQAVVDGDPAGRRSPRRGRAHRRLPQRRRHRGERNVLRRELRGTHSRRGLPHDGDARLPTQLMTAECEGMIS